MTAVNSYAEYDYFKTFLGGGVSSGQAPIDFLSDTIKAAWVTNSYTPSLTAHDFWDDVVASEVANGDGYTTGGETLASKTVSAPSAGTVTYDAADIVWTLSAPITFRYVVVYKSTGSSATSPLMMLVDAFGSNTAVPAGTWTLSWHSSGLFQIA